MIFIKIYGNSLARNSRESFFRLVFLLLKNANEFCLAYQWKEKQYRKVRVGTVALPALKTINSIWFTSIKTANVLLFFSAFPRLFIASFYVSLYDERERVGARDWGELYFYLMRFFMTPMSFAVMGLGMETKTFFASIAHHHRPWSSFPFSSRRILQL